MPALCIFKSAHFQHMRSWGPYSICNCTMSISHQSNSGLHYLLFQMGTGDGHKY